MTRSSFLAGAATVATVLLVASAPGEAAPARSPRRPPPIHETFTPLPCTGAPNNRSTLEQEGCAEQQILRTDKTIDGLNRAIFARLRNDPARRRFNAAHSAWLKYRQAYCQSRSDVFEGGTEAPVAAAECVVGINSQHIKDLKSFLRGLVAPMRESR